MDTAVLMRGSRLAASSEMPPPYEMPAMPMLALSTGVLAVSQSSTAERSAMSLGPATLMTPPERPKPRVA